jgi:hypothetical protein
MLPSAIAKLETGGFMEAVGRLLRAGFVEVGRWQPDREVEVRFEGKMPNEPGVYAIAEGGEIRYVGAAQRSLRERFAKYCRPNNKGSVAVHLRRSIKDALRKTDVTVFAFTPSKSWFSWDADLPINVVAGLEQGLIHQLQPQWNRRGLQFEELKEESEEEF